MGTSKDLMPVVKHAERQIAGFFLPSDFRHVHIHTLCQNAAGDALQAANRSQPVQRAAEPRKNFLSR